MKEEKWTINGQPVADMRGKEWRNTRVYHYEEKTGFKWGVRLQLWNGNSIVFKNSTAAANWINKVMVKNFVCPKITARMLDEFIDRSHDIFQSSKMSDVYPGLNIKAYSFGLSYPHEFQVKR